MGESGDIEVVYEDNHLIVVNKPPLLATMGVAAGEDSMAERAREYLRVRYHKPGNVYLGIVSRLDAHACGVLVFARTSKAAARLAQQFREGTVGKHYLAILDQRPNCEEGRLTDWLIKVDSQRKMAAVDTIHPGAQRAELEWRGIGRDRAGRELVEVRLRTGRKHQIRVQFAARGAPIAGDRKYGSRLAFRGIALLAQRLELEHPVRKTRMTFAIDPPAGWKIGLFRAN
jgi:23S rRNA pseudouridine1911/1915/1917 synthase